MMKKILFIIGILISFIANAQTVPIGVPSSKTNWYQGVFVEGDGMFLTQSSDTTGDKPNRPALKYWAHAGVDSSWWYWDMVKWNKISSGNTSNPIAYVNTIAELIAYNGSANTLVVTDTLRGGLFNIGTATPASADNGISFNATGKGSGRWYRNTTQASSINVCWFGAVHDGVTNDVPAIQAAINYADALKQNFAVGSSQQVWGKTPTVFFPYGIYGIDSAIYLKVGINYKGEYAVIKALDTMGYMVRTYLRAVDYQPGAFANRDITTEGDFLLDGDSLAYAGMFLNTLTRGIIRNVRAVNITGKKWGDTDYELVTYAGFSAFFLNNTITNIQLGDVVALYDSTTHLYVRGIYTVSSMNTTPGINRITLDANIALDSFLVGHDRIFMQYIPTGFMFNGNQDKYENIQASFCGLGMCFSTSVGTGTSVLGYDDNIIDNVFAENCDWGAAYAHCISTLTTKATYQHSKYINLSIDNSCGGLLFTRLYSENGETFVSFNKEDYPSNYVAGNGITMYVNCPPNPVNGWFRAFEWAAAGGDLKLSSASGQFDQFVNPNHAGDFALVKTIATFRTPSLKLSLSGYQNLQQRDSIKYSVINESYAFPSNNVMVSTVDWANGAQLTAGTDRHYSKIELWNLQEPHARLSLDPATGNLNWSNGDSLSKTSIRMFNDTTTGTNENFRILGTTEWMTKQGIHRWYYPDSVYHIRFNSSIPIDKNRDGTDVSTPIVISVTDQATPTFDCNGGAFRYITWVLGADRTIPAPLSPTHGQRILFRIKQDATGGHLITWNSIYSFSTLYPQPVLGTGNGNFIFVEFNYSLATLKWECITPASSSGAVTSTSLTINGTAGNGYISLATQSSNPAAPSSGTVLFSNSSSKFSWRGSANNFVKTFDGSLATADRIDTLPDASGIVVLNDNTAILKNKIIAGGNNTITGLPLTTAVTGILPIANGGTNGTSGVVIPMMNSFAGLTIALSTTSYNFATGANATFTGESSRKTICPIPGTVKSLYVLTTGVQNASGALVITVRLNGAGTALTTTIAAGAGGGTFTDLTHSFSVAAGDVLSVEYANAATTTSAGLLSVSFVIVPN